MTNELYNTIATDLVATANMVNLYRDENRYSKNFRECPFFSELVGKEHMLKLLNIPFEYEFNEDVTRYKAVIVGDIKIEL